ncbi:MAG: Stp1/IreP family PP2C-type Ser/Thr phosphatase [Paenibacillaceae bacterium]
MKTAYKTDIGRIRSVNEDCAAVHSDMNGLTLALLADGMGGHKAGDVASQMTIDVVQRELKAVHHGMSVKQWEEAIIRAIDLANAEVYNKSMQSPEFLGMGTTIVIGLLTNNRLSIAHIGDSRAYLIHKGQFTRITEDHSLVNELLKSGQISQEEAIVHPRRNVITRALGTEAKIEADISHTEWYPGDTLLLCTDGLSNLLAEDSMIEILNMDLSLEGKVDLLIERALEAGGDDNVTVVLVSNEQPLISKGGQVNDRT